MRINKYGILLIVCAFLAFSGQVMAQIKVEISELFEEPGLYEDSFVELTGFYSGWQNAPGSPPVTRSDWVIADSEKKGIYCVGEMPFNKKTGDFETYGIPMRVTGLVKIQDNQPYILVDTAEAQKTSRIEKMQTVRNIIIHQPVNYGEYVGLLGVLAKGYGIKGDRMYLLADPTGTIRLGRMKKLFPTGTILHLRGTVGKDEYGMPMLDDIEIVSYKVDLD